jgi:hypothetical protein
MSLPPQNELYDILNRSLLKDETKIFEEQKKKRDRILERFTLNEDKINNMLRKAYKSIIENLYNNESFTKFNIGSYCASFYPAIEYALKKWFPTSDFELIITHPSDDDFYNINIIISEADKLALSNEIKKYGDLLEEQAKIDEEIELLKRKREELMK